MDGWMDSWGLPFATIIIHEDEKTMRSCGVDWSNSTYYRTSHPWRRHNAMARRRLLEHDATVLIHEEEVMRSWGADCSNSVLQFSSIENETMRSCGADCRNRMRARAAVRLCFLSAAMFGKKTDFPLRRRVAALILLAHEFRVHAHRFEQLRAYFKSMNLG